MRLRPGPDVEVWFAVCKHLSKQLFDEGTGTRGAPFLDRRSPVQMNSLKIMKGEGMWT